MRTLSLSVLLLLAVFFLKTPELSAQDYIPIFSRDYGSRLSFEIDPVTFLYSGYSIHVRYQPMFSERFLVGVGSYALDLPEPIVDFNSTNRNISWDVRIRSAYFLYGELYADEANNGWFIGEQIGFQSFKVSNEREVTGSARFNNVLFLTYIGYSWHPYKGPFYIKPWVGLGYTQKVDGINRVGSMKYDISPLFGYLTFHVGYNF